GDTAHLLSRQALQRIVRVLASKKPRYSLQSRPILRGGLSFSSRRIGTSRGTTQPIPAQLSNGRNEDESDEGIDKGRGNRHPGGCAGAGWAIESGDNGRRLR